MSIKATFIELPPFERHRQNYLNNKNFHRLQKKLMDNPEAGDIIEGTGGLRKTRHAVEKCGKGKCGELRIIYFWWQSGQRSYRLLGKSPDDLNQALPTRPRVIQYGILSH